MLLAVTANLYKILRTLNSCQGFISSLMQQIQELREFYFGFKQMIFQNNSRLGNRVNYTKHGYIWNRIYELILFSKNCLTLTFLPYEYLPWFKWLIFIIIWKYKNRKKCKYVIFKFYHPEIIINNISMGLWVYFVVLLCVCVYDWPLGIR